MFFVGRIPYAANSIVGIISETEAQARIDDHDYGICASSGAYKTAPS